MKCTFSITTIFFCTVLMLSCGQGRQGRENTETAVEDPQTLKAELVLAKDPRKIGPEKPESQYTIEKNIYQINSSENPVYGYWVGDFGKNKINVALASMKDDSIFGHSVCAGNFRPVKGTIEELSDLVYAVNMKEPGDDQYDGEFNFTIDLNKEELSGEWKPYKKTVAAKTYVLTKREYKYDPNAGDFPDASTRYLDVDDVENLLPEQIEMIRNEIYARHGYSFQNLKIRRIFDAKDWYIPMAVDIRDQLTELEAHNIDMLYNYEDYYDEYYDSYGR